MSWYYIGPDKTGLQCSSCCAGFYESYGSCYPYPCPVYPSVFRNYYCPNPENPTPHHVYKWNGNANTSVTISVNNRVCPTFFTNCWSYTPSTGLNSAGRIGGGSCGDSQSYVTSYYNCYPEDLGCSFGCGNPTCVAQTGGRYRQNSCVTTDSGCRCSSGSIIDNCSCTVFSVNYVDSTDPCYVDPTSGGGDPSTCYVYCPDGTVLEYDCYPPYPTCPIPCEAEPPECPSCTDLICGEYGIWGCSVRSCPAPCPAEGYTCSCGECSCNAAFTCCTDAERGWFFNNSWTPSKCRPCYYGWENSSPSGCCDSAWKTKNCGFGWVCCKDGRCYPENTVLCDYTPSF